MDESQRKRIKESIGELIEGLDKDLEAYPEAVADVAFLYIQKHPSWGRNASRAQKRAAYKHWEGKCQACRKDVAFDNAVFHHLERRIPDQHGPKNLLPYHPKCHDDAHEVKVGSLSKGTPRLK